MSGKLNRRSFIKKSVALSAGTTLGLGFREKQVKVAAAERKGKTLPGASGSGMPMGRIGKLKISRLISGGNLISGWAHARDLIYMHDLMRHYNTDEKVMETLELLEENGVNTIIGTQVKGPTGFSRNTGTKEAARFNGLPRATRT